ncbi:MAG: DUF4248 domain-containing protein [Bacteroides sp.]|nr:DUF4248 domain-containing protein [Bacteroides sp.]MCD8079599.1 DUF4248 domain-containing protein [Bacteroides sp.]
MKKHPVTVCPEEDERFPIRTYLKRDLVHLYLPHLPIRSALRTWNEWIQLHPTLLEDLQCTGYRKSCKNLSPVQVKMIVEALGEP